MISEPTYFDKAGQPIDWRRCAELTEDDDYQTLAVTLDGGYRISTVWLGKDQLNWLDPPLIFETMIFRDGNPLEYQRRYATEDQAADGHRKAVAYIEDLRAEKGKR